jgi:hypothetical protein
VQMRRTMGNLPNIIAIPRGLVCIGNDVTMSGIKSSRSYETTSADVVSFVNHDQHGLGDDVEAACHGLHHTNPHQVGGHAVARLDAAVSHVHRGECEADLIADLLPMRRQDDAVALRGGVRHDEGLLDGLTAAGWQYMQHAPVLREDCPGLPCEMGCRLNLPTRHHQAPCQQQVWTRRAAVTRQVFFQVSLRV